MNHLGERLIAIHTHANLCLPEEIVYKEKDVVKLIEELTGEMVDFTSPEQMALGKPPEFEQLPPVEQELVDHKLGIVEMNAKREEEDYS